MASFALFLVFWSLRKAKRDERKWLLPVATVIAAFALAGGVYLAYHRAETSSTAPPQGNQVQTSQQQNTQAQQTSSGAASPNIQGVEGNVNISIDQSLGKGELQKAPEKKVEKKKRS